MVRDAEGGPQAGRASRFRQPSVSPSRHGSVRERHIRVGGRASGCPSVSPPRRSAVGRVSIVGDSRSVSPSRRSGAGRRTSRDRFSFVNCNLRQLEEALATKRTNGRFNRPLWEAVLSGEPCNDIKPLMNRTLRYWVKTFNRWQAAGRKRGSAPPEMVEARDLQDILQLSRYHTERIAVLFVYTGQTLDPKEIMVPIASVFAAGVILSWLITTKHKFAYLFGLFDTGDSGWLSEEQFGSFLHAMYQGISVAFSVPLECMPPKPKCLEISRFLYTHISSSAAKRLQELYKDSGTDVKTQVVRALRERKLTLSAPGESKSKGEQRSGHQVVSYSVLQDFTIGDAADNDPVSLPFQFLMRRFCSSRRGHDIEDEFDKTLAEFQLSHRSAVAVPDEPPVSLRKLLSRVEVTLARSFFNEMRRNEKEGKYNDQQMLDMLMKNHQNLLVDMHISPDSLLKVQHGLEYVTFTRSCTWCRMCFFDLLRKMCPEARPSHLRMFDNWCAEYDDFVQRRQKKTELSQALEAIEVQAQLPFLPHDELKACRREFDRVDVERKGYIYPEVLVSNFDVSGMKDLESVLINNDGYRDGVITFDDFLKITYSHEYQLPCENPAQELFKTLLESEVKLGQIRLDYDKTRLNMDLAVRKKLDCEPVFSPQAVLPIVGDDTWVEWHAVFHALDCQGGGTITVEEMMHVAQLPAEVSGLISKSINSDTVGTGFTLQDFLQAMLRAHGLRRPGDDGDAPQPSR